MRIRRIILFLIILFVLSSCSSQTHPKNGINLTSKPGETLGDPLYIKKIQSIASSHGYRAALQQIMLDVDKYGYQLDNNDINNLSRFHKLISALVYKIGTVDMKTHYFRNKLNRVPKTLRDLINVNKKLPINKRWRLLPVKNSLYHIQGPDGFYNLKFLSYDGYFEAVYNRKGVLLDENTDPINMGTYNYAAGIPEINAHGKFDVSPYLKFGNSPNSLQKSIASINAGVKKAISIYKKNAAKVYIYRQKLFGMQSGRVI